MKKYKFSLVGTYQEKFRHQYDWRKKKPEREVLYEIIFESDLTKNQILEKKYDFVPYKQNKREIEKWCNIKIPVTIRRVDWKVKEIIEEEK